MKDETDFLKKKLKAEEVENAFNKQKNDDIIKNVVKSKRTKRDKYFFVSKPGL